MNHSTGAGLAEFGWHDSPIEEIETSVDTVALHLAWAVISDSHPANPTGKSQFIEPCRLTFRGVVAAKARAYRQNKDIYEDHPKPQSPIEDQILELEILKDDSEVEVRISGFCREGWTDWFITAKRYLVDWDRFTGSYAEIAANTGQR